MLEGNSECGSLPGPWRIYVRTMVVVLAVLFGLGALGHLLSATKPLVLRLTPHFSLLVGMLVLAPMLAAGGLALRGLGRRNLCIHSAVGYRRCGHRNHFWPVSLWRHAGVEMAGGAAADRPQLDAHLARRCLFILPVEAATLFPRINVADSDIADRPDRAGVCPFDGTNGHAPRLLAMGKRQGPAAKLRRGGFLCRSSRRVSSPHSCPRTQSGDRRTAGRILSGPADGFFRRVESRPALVGVSRKTAPPPDPVFPEIRESQGGACCRPMDGASGAPAGGSRSSAAI